MCVLHRLVWMGLVAADTAMLVAVLAGPTDPTFAFLNVLLLIAMTLVLLARHNA